MAIHVIRHTKVAVPKSVCYGQTDVALADTFPADRERVANQISGLAFEQVFVSPATRCQRLAMHLCADFETDQRLWELNFGDWEMMEWDDITDPYLMKWMENYVGLPCPNGESFKDMVSRVEQFVQEQLVAATGEICVITHAGVVRCLHHIINEVPLKEVFNIQVRSGSITVFDNPAR